MSPTDCPALPNTLWTFFTDISTSSSTSLSLDTSILDYLSSSPFFLVALGAFLAATFVLLDLWSEAAFVLLDFWLKAAFILFISALERLDLVTNIG